VAEWLGVLPAEADRDHGRVEREPAVPTATKALPCGRRPASQSRTAPGGARAPRCHRVWADRGLQRRVWQYPRSGRAQPASQVVPVPCTPEAAAAVPRPAVTGPSNFFRPALERTRCKRSENAVVLCHKMQDIIGVHISRTPHKFGVTTPPRPARPLGADRTPATNFPHSC
jgi:hypothetical protein